MCPIPNNFLPLVEIADFKLTPPRACRFQIAVSGGAPVQVVVVYSPGYPSARVDDVPIAILGAAESTAQKKKRSGARAVAVFAQHPERSREVLARTTAWLSGQSRSEFYEHSYLIFYSYLD